MSLLQGNHVFFCIHKVYLTLFSSVLRNEQEGMSYKPNLHQHLPGTSGNQGNIPSPSSMATIQSYKPFLNDFGPPSLGFPQGPNGSQVPQSKYAELLAIIEELGKEIRPTYAGSKSAMERLKRGIIHARGLVRECLAETERNARS
uniref:Cyclin dependent kinase 2 associated protein 1 n=5 Tax=Cyprininae TaxID=2743694 RepID=A0A9J8C892_CYPCA